MSVSCLARVLVYACVVAREEVFALPLTDDAAIKNVINDFAPFYQLWTTVSEFDTAKQHWLSGLFIQLKAAEITESMERWWFDCSNLMKKFKVCVGSPACWKPCCVRGGRRWGMAVGVGG